MNSKFISDFINEIKSANSIAVLMHNNPDGDALGCACAMFELLQDNFGKKAEIFYTGKLPEFLHFVPNASVARDANALTDIPIFDLAIAVDVAATKVLSTSTNDILSSARNTVKIDHHANTADFAKINLHEICAAAAEVIYKIARDANWKINQNAATALYTAILSDTGFMKWVDSPQPFEISAVLIRLGANARDIGERLKMTGKESAMTNIKGIAKSKFFFDGELALTSFNRANYKLLDDSGIIATSTLRSIRTVEYVVIIKETDKGLFYISLRSRSKPVNTIAKKLGGGGHEFAAAFKFIGTLPEARETILSAFETELGRKR